LIKYKESLLGSQQAFVLQASIFFFILYIFNFQRGLVRHGFVERNDIFMVSSFYLALSLLILYLVKYKAKVNLFASFLFLSFFVIILFKYFPANTSPMYFEHFLTKPNIVKIDSTLNSEALVSRCIIDEEFEKDNYADLKKFMDANLTAKQSFFDFSNTPMLYYYTNRRVPSYFCQPLQNTVDDYLQIEQIKRCNLLDVPIVLYSNYPRTWWDATDGVPNAIRQYLIADYIYKNYKPFSVINKHSLWVSKDSEFSYDNIIEDTLINKAQTYKYNLLAHAINQHFSNSNNTVLELLGTEKEVLDNEKHYSFNVSKGLSQQSGLFVKIYLEASDKSDSYRIDYVTSDYRVLGTNTFKSIPGVKEYMFMLSNHYLWHKYPVSSLRVYKNNSSKVIKVEYFKDTRIDGYTN
jgi:hypothetical protein